MLNKITILFLLLFFFTGKTNAQTGKNDKKLDNVYDLLEKGKTKEADEYLEKILQESPEFGKGWDVLAKIRLKEYEDSKGTENIFKNLTVTTKDKKGKEVKGGDDSLTKALTALLSNLSPTKIAYSKYIYTLRKALCTADDAYQCSALLRTYYIDIEIDTALNPKALKQFNKAEEEFGKKNYEMAAKLYKRAIEEQPDFYKAALYMGDCFYFTENYVNAILAFKEAVEKFPTLLEPRKYLIDSYLKAHLNDKALDETINAMAVYPDLFVSVRMEDAAYYLNKKLEIKWTPRPLLPNKIKIDSVKSINDYSESKPAAIRLPWTIYQDAAEKIKDKCNEKGIIVKPTPLTQSKYMEVYAWEEMLNNSTDPALDQARKMQKDGYLDCYVLVSCFHYDFYAQYADFVLKNKTRIGEYFRRYLVAKK